MKANLAEGTNLSVNHLVCPDEIGNARNKVLHYSDFSDWWLRTADRRAKAGEIILYFDSCLYTEETARQFLDAYLGLVDTLGNNPHVKIGDVPAASDDNVTCLIKELSTSVSVNLVERVASTRRGSSR